MKLMFQGDCRWPLLAEGFFYTLSNSYYLDIYIFMMMK